MNEWKAARVGAALGVVVAVCFWIIVYTVGLTLGQRCETEANPSETSQACIQRLQADNDKGEQ